MLNDVFTPRPEELERAGAIVSALDGVREVDGEMVDEARRKPALQVLARGEAAGLRR